MDLEGGTMMLGSIGATVSLNETADGRVTGGQLTATRSLNAPNGVEPAGLGIRLTASVDLGRVTFTRGHIAQTGGGNSSIDRYVSIEPSQNNSDLSAKLTFQYRDEELGTISDESNLEFFKSSNGGATWSAEGISNLDPAANTAKLNGIRSFSRWTLGSSAAPLPVELASFEGAVVESEAGRGPGAAVRLTWTTASETGSAGFEVQRRVESGAWRQVGYRESKAEGGTTAEALTYRFTDAAVPYAADSVRYRLRQVDLDGSTTLLDPVTVARSVVNDVQLLGTAPNPARQQAIVRYALPEQRAGKGATMRLYDVLGREVRTTDVHVEPGRHKRTLDVGNLPSGVYFLRLRAGGETRTQKLTVMH
jgi:hypothetical protein